MILADAAHLAAICGFHRNRVAEYRAKAGAPADLDAGAWLAWLRLQPQYRRALLRRAAVRLQAHIEAHGDGLSLDEPSTPAAAQETTQADPATQIDWKLRRERALALRAEMELAAAEGRLVPRDRVAQVLRLAAATLIESLATAHADLAPSLQGASPDTRKAHRAAWDALTLRLRDHLATRLRALLAEHLPHPGA